MYCLLRIFFLLGAGMINNTPCRAIDWYVEVEIFYDSFLGGGLGSKQSSAEATAKEGRERGSNRQQTADTTGVKEWNGKGPERRGKARIKNGRRSGVGGKALLL